MVSSSTFSFVQTLMSAWVETTTAMPWQRAKIPRDLSIVRVTKDSVGMALFAKVCKQPNPDSEWNVISREMNRL